MASFNLTAQINLQGPGNVKKIVAGIQKQLNGLNANVNLNLNQASVKALADANKKLQLINTSLNKVAASAGKATSAVSQFATTLNSIGTGNVSVKIQNASQATQNLGNNAKISLKNLKLARTEMEEFGRQSALAVRRFTAFASVTSVIYGVNNAINRALADFIKFDRQMVRISQVTGTAVGGLKGLQGTISELSTGFGVSSSSLAEISVTLSQAGFGVRDVQKALKALALTDVAPTFDNLNATVEGSIALLRQFSIDAGQLEASLGSINAVAAQFAVESSDIITAIQRAGGVFAAASRGVSEGTDALNEFIAIFTSVRATTRESAETIATGLRTIFTRIQRGDTINALKEFGVNLQDAEGKFVGAYRAVELLSQGLSTLDPRDIRFTQIIEELGGFRQIGKVIPLISQFATAQAALKAAQEGQSSLADSAALSQQALAVQISKVREQFLQLVRDVAGSDTFKGLISGGLAFASVLLKVADSIKGLLPILALLGAAKGAAAIGQFARGFGGGLRRSGFAKGGVVPGSGNTDSVPAMLTPGEFVLRKSAVRSIGTEKLHKMNKYGSGDKVKDIANTPGVSKQLARSISKNKEEPFLKGVATNADDRFTAGIKKYFTSKQDVENYIKTLKKPAAQESFRKRIFFGNASAKGEAFEEYISATKTKADRTSSISKTYPVDFHKPGSFYGEAKNVAGKIDDDIFIDKLYRARVADGSYKNLKDQAGKPPSSESGQNINLGKIKVFESKFFTRGGFAEAPIVDDIKQASGSILPKPGSAIQSLIASGGGAVDIDRTLKRTIGDQAYGRARTMGQQTASLDKYFRDPSARLNDLKSAPLTVFGQELISAIKSRQLDPKTISIISKSMRVKGDAEYLSGLFGIPTANMIFTQGGSKQPAVDAMRTKGPRVNRVKKATGGSSQDTVPAMLTPGEFVFTKESASRIGYGNLRKMNTRPQGFNKGGIVGFANGGGPTTVYSPTRDTNVAISSKTIATLKALENSLAAINLPADKLTKVLTTQGQVDAKVYQAALNQTKANLALAKSSAKTSDDIAKVTAAEQKLRSVRSQYATASRGGGGTGASLANAFDSQAFIGLSLAAGTAAVGLEAMNTPLASAASTLITTLIGLGTSIAAVIPIISGLQGTFIAQAAAAVASTLGLAGLGTILAPLIPIGAALAAVITLATAGIAAYASYQKKAAELAKGKAEKRLESANDSAAKAMEKFAKDASAINFANINKAIAEQSDAGQQYAQARGMQTKAESQSTTGLLGVGRETAAWLTLGLVDSIEEATKNNENRLKQAGKDVVDANLKGYENAQKAAGILFEKGKTLTDIQNAAAGTPEAELKNQLIGTALGADKSYQEQVQRAAMQGKEIDPAVTAAAKQKIEAEIFAAGSTLDLQSKIQEAAREQDRLSKIARKLTQNFELMSSVMKQAMAITEAESQARQRNIDTIFAASQGNAKIPEIMDNTNTIIENAAAATEPEKTQARARTTANLTPILGASRAAEVSALATYAPEDMTKAIEKAISETAPADLNAGAVSSVVNAQLDALKAAGLGGQNEKELRDAADAMSKSIEQRIASEGPNISDQRRREIIDEESKKFNETIGNMSKNAKEVATTLNNTLNNALNKYAQNLQSINQLESEAIKYKQQAIAQELESRDKISRLFDDIATKNAANVKSTGLAAVGDLTGGVTDPAIISQNIQNATREIDRLTKARDAESDIGKRKALTDQINQQTVSLNNNRQALDKLSEVTQQTIDILLQEAEARKSLQDANKQFAETLLTSGPDELKAMDQALVRANQRLNGFIPQAGASQRKRFFELLKQTGSVRKAAQGVGAETRKADLQFLEQTRGVRQFRLESDLYDQNKRRGMGDDEARAAAAQQAQQQMRREEATIMAQMGQEAGLGRLGQSIVGQAVATTFDRRNDPMMAGLSKSLESEVATQKSLNETLQKLNETLAKMAGIANEADFQDTTTAATNRARASTPKQKGGLIYAANGQLINFEPKGTDTVPAMLTPGEFVVNRKATQKNMGLLQAINGGKINTYAKGGMVKYLAGGGGPIDDEELRRLEKERTDAQQTSWMMHQAAGISPDEVVDRTSSLWAESQVGAQRWNSMTEEQKKQETDKYRETFQGKWDKYNADKQLAMEQSAKSAGYESAKQDTNSQIVGVNFFNERKKQSLEQFNAAQTAYEKAQEEAAAAKPTSQPSLVAQTVQPPIQIPPVTQAAQPTTQTPPVAPTRQRFTDSEIYIEQASALGPRSRFDIGRPRNMAEVQMYREGLMRGMTIDEIKYERQQNYLNRFGPDVRERKTKDLSRRGMLFDPSQRQSLYQKTYESEQSVARGGNAYTIEDARDAKTASDAKMRDTIAQAVSGARSFVNRLMSSAGNAFSSIFDTQSTPEDTSKIDAIAQQQHTSNTTISETAGTKPRVSRRMRLRELLAASGQEAAEDENATKNAVAQQQLQDQLNKAKQDEENKLAAEKARQEQEAARLVAEQEQQARKAEEERKNKLWVNSSNPFWKTLGYIGGVGQATAELGYGAANVVAGGITTAASPLIGFAVSDSAEEAKGRAIDAKLLALKDRQVAEGTITASDRDATAEAIRRESGRHPSATAAAAQVGLEAMAQGAYTAVEAAQAVVGQGPHMTGEQSWLHQGDAERVAMSGDLGGYTRAAQNIGYGAAQAANTLTGFGAQTGTSIFGKGAKFFSAIDNAVMSPGTLFGGLGKLANTVTGGGLGRLSILQDAASATQYGLGSMRKGVSNLVDMASNTRLGQDAAYVLNRIIPGRGVKKLAELNKVKAERANTRNVIQWLRNQDAADMADNVVYNKAARARAADSARQARRAQDKARGLATQKRVQRGRTKQAEYAAMTPEQRIQARTSRRAAERGIIDPRVKAQAQARATEQQATRAKRYNQTRMQGLQTKYGYRLPNKQGKAVYDTEAIARDRLARRAGNRGVNAARANEYAVDFTSTVTNTGNIIRGRTGMGRLDDIIEQRQNAPRDREVLDWLRGDTPTPLRTPVAKPVKQTSISPPTQQKVKPNQSTSPISYITAQEEKLARFIEQQQSVLAQDLSRYASSPEKAKRLTDNASEIFGVKSVKIADALTARSGNAGDVRAAGAAFSPGSQTLKMTTGRLSGESAANVVRHELGHALQTSSFKDFGKKGGVQKYEQSIRDYFGSDFNKFLTDPNGYSKLLKDVKGDKAVGTLYSADRVMQEPVELLTSLIQASKSDAFKANPQAIEMMKKLMKFHGYATGGVVHASGGTLISARPKGTDTVPAMLTPGEFVINREATSKYLPVLRAINNGYNTHGEMVNHLARGGQVGVPRYMVGGGITERGRNNGVSVNSQIQGLEEFKSVVAQFNEAMTGGTSNMNNAVSQMTQASTNFASTADSINQAATNIPDRVNVAQNVRVDGIPNTLNDFSSNLLNSSMAQNSADTNQKFNDLNRKNEGSLGLSSPNSNTFIS